MSVFIVTPRDAVDVNQLRSVLDSCGYKDLLDEQQHTFRPHVSIVVWEPTTFGRWYATRSFRHVYVTTHERIGVNELARHLCQ